MSTLGFLAALPALLAITAFVAYRLLGSQTQGQQITKDIVGLDAVRRLLALGRERAAGTHVGAVRAGA